jgi:ABC-type Mn2+/Zn2+ transport system ATPase subunit
VLVLDEPNTYFDKQYIEEIYQHIEQEAKHSTVIMVSHDTDYIEKHAKRIITIQETLEISR